MRAIAKELHHPCPNEGVAALAVEPRRPLRMLRVVGAPAAVALLVGRHVVPAGAEDRGREGRRLEVSVEGPGPGAVRPDDVRFFAPLAPVHVPRLDPAELGGCLAHY